MPSYMKMYIEEKDRADSLQRMVDAMQDQTITKSMMRFINQRGHSESFAKFLLEEISEKFK